jgi:glutathione S-transferase
MSTYKFHYYNARGRGEICRLIFAAAGEKFEDIRYELTEWPSHKAEMPLGQIPVLEYNGVKLPQSLSIARFLAQQFELAGKDNFEQAKVDAVVDTILDLTTKTVAFSFEKDQAKKQELIKKFLDEELSKHLENLEVLRKLYGDDGPYFVGNKLTWADLYFYHCGDTFLRILGGNCLDGHSWLQQNRAEVEKQPKIAEYLKNRPKTAF